MCFALTTASVPSKQNCQSTLHPSWLLRTEMYFQPFRLFKKADVDLYTSKCKYESGSWFSNSICYPSFFLCPKY